MGIIGTLKHTEYSFTRFAYDGEDITATHQGVSGHNDGETVVLRQAKSFEDACRFVMTSVSPYGRNPNFRFEMSGLAWFNNFLLTLKD